MKGGSATKMMLESILADALARIDEGAARADVAGSGIWSALREYETAVRRVYCRSEQVSKLVELAGVSLREGGRLLYLGVGSHGVAALVDASECPPTFNAGWHEVRGVCMNEVVVCGGVWW
jgi:hypothetical protein